MPLGTGQIVAPPILLLVYYYKSIQVNFKRLSIYFARLPLSNPSSQSSTCVFNFLSTLSVNPYCLKTSAISELLVISPIIHSKASLLSSSMSGSDSLLYSNTVGKNITSFKINYGSYLQLFCRNSSTLCLVSAFTI